MFNVPIICTTIYGRNSPESVLHIASYSQARTSEICAHRRSPRALDKITYLLPAHVTTRKHLQGPGSCNRLYSTSEYGFLIHAPHPACGLQFRKEVQTLHDFPSGLKITRVRGCGGAHRVGFSALDPEGGYLWLGVGGRTLLTSAHPVSDFRCC